MSEIKLLEVRYLGRVKNRPDGSETAFGYCNNTWSVAITKAALYAYFCMSERPGEAATLYSTLGVNAVATDAEIKTAWKRLVKQWHPDLCKEQDARKQFDAIQHAYGVLSTKRAKYDAGLMLQASLAKVPQPLDADQEYGYRSPLRCGYILAEGSNKSGKFTVSKIIQWNDITNSHGQVLVVSWQYGDKHHTEAWA